MSIFPIPKSSSATSGRALIASATPRSEAIAAVYALARKVAEEVREGKRPAMSADTACEDRG